MPDTIREQIIQAFAAKAQVLSPKPVERVRRSEIVSADVFVTVWDGASSPVNLSYGVEHKQFALGIEAAVLALEPSPVANALIGLIEQLFMSGDRTYGGLVKQLTWQGSQVSYPDEGSQVVTVRVTYQIEYAHPVGDPYTNAEITP